jgi:hypothetical protein
MVDPKVVWTTAIAPSGLAIYTGDKFPDWYGDIFAGGLKSQDIRRINLDNAGNVIGQYALRIGQRARDIRQGPDGMLYVLTEENHGSLINPFISRDVRVGAPHSSHFSIGCDLWPVKYSISSSALEAQWYGRG